MIITKIKQKISAIIKGVVIFFRSREKKGYGNREMEATAVGNNQTPRNNNQIIINNQFPITKIQNLKQIDKDVDNFEKAVNKKTAKISGSLGNSNLMQSSGLSSCSQYNTPETNVKSDSKSQKAMEVGGFEPPDPWMISRDLHQVTPMADSLYQKDTKTLKHPSTLLRTGENKKTNHSEENRVENENSEIQKEERAPMSVEPKLAVTTNVLEIFCPYCASANFVKRGTRQKKNERVQLYLCQDCQRTFTPGAVKGKHYPMATILDAISLYYLGYSLERSCEIVNR